MVSVMYIWCVCMQHVYSMCILASALDCNGNYGDDNSNHDNIVVNNNNVINLYFSFYALSGKYRFRWAQSR